MGKGQLSVVFMRHCLLAQGGPGPKQAQLTEPVCRRLSGVVLGNLIVFSYRCKSRGLYLKIIRVKSNLNSTTDAHQNSLANPYVYPI
jgi:hypothetical protein